MPLVDICIVHTCSFLQLLSRIDVDRRFGEQFVNLVSLANLCTHLHTRTYHYHTTHITHTRTHNVHMYTHTHTHTYTHSPHPQSSSLLSLVQRM